MFRNPIIPNAVFENTMSLDDKLMEHSRNAYSLMELLGDIAGLFELIQTISGVLIFRISKISFYISAMKKLFWVKCVDPNIFNKSMKQKRLT